MALRDLFCILEATETSSKTSLEQALALARGYDARASVLVAGPQVSAPYSPFATAGDMAKSENEKIRARAAALATEAKRALEKIGAAGEIELSLDTFPDLVRTMKKHSLCNDVTVLDRPGGLIEHSEAIFEEMLFGAAYPVFVAVPDRKPAEKIGKIVLAWDGSIHAVRALAAAVSLFEGFKEADVAVVTGEKDLSESVPAARIAAHIERHGAKAKVVELNVEKGGAAATIDGHAVRAGADLIVMGGFGRSRLREFVLGGVTRELSQNARTPLLLAH